MASEGRLRTLAGVPIVLLGAETRGQNSIEGQRRIDVEIVLLGFLRSAIGVGFCAVLAELGERNLVWSSVDVGGTVAAVAAVVAAGAVAGAAGFGGVVVSGGAQLVLLPVGPALSAG